VVAAFIAEFGFGSVGRSAIRAYEFKFMATLTAELGVLAILKLAFWAFHLMPPGNISGKDGW